MNWDLSQLYSSFDSENFQDDILLLTKLINSYNNWCEKNLKNSIPSPKTIVNYINQKCNIEGLLSKLYNYSSLESAKNSRNETALAKVEEIEQLQTLLTTSEVQFQRYVSQIEDMNSFLADYPLLSQHEYYIKKSKENASYLLSDKEELILSKIKNIASNAWQRLYELATSTHLVPITIDKEAKKLPLAVVRNMAFDKDKEVRFSAYQAELESYKTIDDTVAACLSNIKGEVITECSLRKHSDVLNMTLIQCGLSKKAFFSLMHSIEKYLPIFRNYLKIKAKYLGYDGALPFYDLFAPVGSYHKSFDLNDAEKFIVKHFNDFSPDLSEFAKNAFEKQWIDAFPQEGKVGGAFCANIHPIKESRILANFTGNFEDVTTLAHELGHAFHNECLKNDSLLNSDPPLPLAETASIFFETLILNAAIKEVDESSELTLIENNLASLTQTIVDIYSRFLFEESVFKERKKGSLSSEKLCMLMKQAQMTAYGDGLDQEYLHPYMWLCKPHYYSASANYYNFPYAFGNLFALGLFEIYQKEPQSFSSKMVKLLRSTSKNDIVDVIKTINIDIENESFWTNTLEHIARQVNTFKSLCN